MKLKDKKIRIFTSFRGEPNDNGFNPPMQWKAIHEGSLWAHYRHLSGKEIFASAMPEIQVEDVVFTVNWRDDISTKMVIGFRGKYYDITRIDDYEGYKQDLKLYCTYNAARRSDIEKWITE